MIKSIITDSKVLKQKSELVTKDDDIKSIVQDLKDTLEALKHGYALAAPQIGIFKQICYCKIPKEYNEQTKEMKYLELVIINPIISEKSQKLINRDEGCLSFPGVRINTDRCNLIVLNYEDENLKKTTALFDDLKAFVVQHETDHLLGITIFDRKHKDINNRKK